ncbi:hypothetical protein [Embleya sp. AB8]|uniref:hypothetical protein n=1 Tax=Embleya sp. AB8 TaxID=3156304 RepID=UPI003C7315D1
MNSESDDDQVPIYESVADVQLERRVAALERLAEARDVPDRTEAPAVRQTRTQNRSLEAMPHARSCRRIATAATTTVVGPTYNARILSATSLL